jgi:ubiquitin C-terminal hydrolase
MHAYMKKYPKLDDMPLTKSLQHTLRDLCVAGPAFEPQVSQNGDLKRKFLTREQQDAHELMQFVLSMLDDEAELPQNRIPTFSLVQDPVWEWLGRNLLEENKSITSQDYGRLNPFCGLMKSTLSVDCAKCGAVSSPCLQKFSTVSLAIPLRRQDWSLEDSLQEFTIEETVTGVECPDCYTKRTKAKKSPNQFTALPPRTGVRQTARKRLTFTRAPKVLCLHLRRLVRAPSGEPVKSNGHVRFPLELDLTPYCSFGCGPEPPSAFIRRKTPMEVPKEQDVDDTVWQFINRPRFGT